MSTCTKISITANGRVRCSRAVKHRGKCNFRTTTLTRTQSKVLNAAVEADPERKKKIVPSKVLRKTFEALERLGLMKSQTSFQFDGKTIETVKVYTVTAFGARVASS